MAAEVEINEEAIRGLALSDEVQADLRARMDKVVDVAKATAPVDTGAYKASIHQVEEPDDDGSRHVDTGVDYAIYVEYGTRVIDRNGRRIHRPHYNLGNALDAAGGDH